MQSREEKPDKRASSGLALSFFTLPLRVMQPLLPRLLPVLVCLLCIPLLMLFSGAAGWVVWRNVPVGWKADAFLQYGEASIPFANVVLPPILADQPYDVSLHLVVPTTESNYALGNFMATLKLTTAYNESIITVRRPAALIPPRSSLAKQLLLGAPATVRLDIPLLSQFVSGTGAVTARLELGRTDAWKSIGNGQGRELSVVEATLKGRVRPRGTMAVLARYPRLSTFVSTFTFFFISLLVVCCVLFIAVRSEDSSHLPPQKGSSSSDEYHDGDDDFPGSRLDGKQYVRRQVDKHDSASGSSTPDDDRPPSTHATSSSVRLPSLRKRRSSPALEPLNTTRFKIEDIPTRAGTTPPPYPKSPYPRPSSTGSDSSSRQHSAALEPVSPSDADAESP